VNSEDTISWATFGLDCDAGFAKQTVPRPSLV